MDTNSYWNVFVPNNKHTFPIIENRTCMVYASEEIYHSPFLTFAYFEKGRFYALNGEVLPTDIPLFWRYVEKLPNGIKSVQTEKCSKRNRDCEFEDDGYCMHNGYKPSCKYRKCIEEFYAINY